MLRKSFDDLDANGQAGDWVFFNNDTIVMIQWGPTSDDLASCYLNGGGHPSWDWNGNREAPTLSPSISVKGGPDGAERWHGYLEEGKLRRVGPGPNLQLEILTP